MPVGLGVLCEVCATLLGTMGKQLVTYSGRQDEHSRAVRLKVTGLLVTTFLGPLLDASAYAMAPQSLIAPLNGLDVVWNTCLAPLTLGERVTRTHISGAALVFLGSGLSACFGQHKSSSGTLEDAIKIFNGRGFHIFCLVGGGGLLVAFAVVQRRPRGVRDWMRGVALGTSAGFVAGNMFFLSTALGLVRSCLYTGDWSAWRHFLPWAVLL
eukprot:CAMPEP_0197880664 /NCGR_PEP_ID=MMETSP1439-20131203/8396_1 /TAXON_ID=66791 /ORGANISM="Gonyaulax spinifera, Strain CCMP409" /LENGTH=210 /DNA_ID=CAMNT_0043500227 /DNA_START=64 /DNA_END=693 /DNA_ORIENTATION=-